MKKTKGLFIGRLRGKRPRLTNISWISDNIKTLGIFHGYNIDTDDIWKYYKWDENLRPKEKIGH
jgi:hypothetical protein